MKHIIEFKLPEERDELTLAQHGGVLYSILFDLDQWLRNQTKYPAEDTHVKTIEAYENVRDTIHELCDESGVDLYNFVE